MEPLQIYRQPTLNQTPHSLMLGCGQLTTTQPSTIFGNSLLDNRGDVTIINNAPTTREGNPNPLLHTRKLSKHLSFVKTPPTEDSQQLLIAPNTTIPNIGNSTNEQDPQNNRPPLQIPPKSASITNIENKKKNLNVQIPPGENNHFSIMKVSSHSAAASNATSACSSVSSSPSTISTNSTNLSIGSSAINKLNQQSHTIESGLIENMTSKKKRGTTRENIILLDSILRERRDIFYAILNNVTKIRLYRKKRRNPTHNNRSMTTASTTMMHTQTMTSPKEEFGNEYIVKLNNGLKCEAFETSTAQEFETYGHKRQFKASMYYTQNEMDRLENQSMMDPSPLLREDKLSFLDQLHGLHKPSVQSYRVIDLIHPYHLFSTELEIIEPKSGRDLGRVMKKSYSIRTQYLIQTVEGVKKQANGNLSSHDKYKYATLFIITKHKSNGKKEEPSEKHVLDEFQVRNIEGENVAIITRKFNSDYELKGYTPDYIKVNFLMETTPFERTLIMSSLFLLDIEYFGH